MTPTTLSIPDDDGGEMLVPGRSSAYGSKRRSRQKIDMELNRLKRDERETVAALKKNRARRLYLWWARIFAPHEGKTHA